MVLLAEALLESGQSGSAPRRGRPLARAAISSAAALGGALLLAAGVFLLGVEHGRATPHAGVALGASLVALNASRLRAPTALAAGLTANCYTFTGGTCHIDACDPDRGATCEDGLCMCVAAGCAGADGRCHKSTNREVASGFTLTNAQFDWQKMYMPATDPFDHIKTTAVPSQLNFNQDRWALHLLPGEAHGHKRYFLTTQRFPEYVATIRATTGTAVSLFGAYEVGLDREWDPASLTLLVCMRQDGKLMIGSSNKLGTMQWLYLHHGTWEVFTWDLGDPGPEGYWTPDPPIPSGSLEACGNV